MNRIDLPTELPQAIADALDQGAIVITANQRAARTLRYGFDEQNRRMCLPYWQPATVLSWDAWITECWQNLVVSGKTERILLSDAQEHLLWHQILSADPDLNQNLQSPDSLAELAAHAWAILVRYEGQHRLRGTWGGQETKALQRWASEFSRICQAQQFMPRVQAEGVLKAAVMEGHLSLPQRFLLVGFDEFSPAQNTLLSSIKTTGRIIEEFRGSAPTEHRQSLETIDETQEIFAAARWAKSRLEEEPDARLGIIVPSLGSRRNPIDRIFREVLAPELEDIRASHDTTPYEFSVGTSLSQRPLIRVALNLIRWLVEPLSTEQVSFLLISPLFAMQEEERHARARFDAFDLRKSKMLLSTISIPSLGKVIGQSKYKSQLSGLLNTLDAMSRFSLNVIQNRNTYTAWTDIIRELLKTARWGRLMGEDSVEFQTRQRWNSLLDQMATLDFLGGSVAFEDVLRELERLAEQTIFSPESHNAAVQVMGTLEAAGSTFDAIWFLGAGDLQWPIRSSLNPLLPHSLQRELRVPGTDAAEDDARACGVVERILSSAPIAIFSYAAEAPAGKQHLAPILRSFHLEKILMESIAPALVETEDVTLEEFSDTASIASMQDEIISGGAEVLKLQAACGFRAFAERRLGSTELRRIDLGMDASERGNIVHRILEHFWKDVRTQANLKAMTFEDRNASLVQSIDHVLRRVICATPWERAYVELQFARLKTLLTPWLELELQRSPFTVKFSEEETKNVHVGPLRLNLRVDRIDVTESGEVILDYKTGSAKSADWQGERPDEPQLPLYAVQAKAPQSETPLADIAFAHIRAGKDMSLEGYETKVTPEKQSSKRPSTPFEEQLVEWQRVLEELAIAFHRGDAYVDPKNYPSTCTHCAQRILCRLNPAAFDEDIDEETAVGSANG